MATRDELHDQLGKTAPIGELLTALREQPVDLLARIAQEYERTEQPVPDHRLRAAHYLTQVALRALQEPAWCKRWSQADDSCGPTCPRREARSTPGAFGPNTHKARVVKSLRLVTKPHRTWHDTLTPEPDLSATARQVVIRPTCSTVGQ
jgi:hypothetical protein